MLFKRHQNTLKCYGKIFNGNGVDFMYYFEQMQKEHNEITIRLHTYGGSVIDGNLIFNAINQSTSNVTIIIDGLAASMGAIILMATDNVQMAENAYIMVHAPSGSVSGTSRDLKNTANLLESIETNFINKLIQRTGKPKKQIEKLMAGDNWFSAKQAKEMGLVSEIIESKNTAKISIEEPQNVGELEVFNAYASLLVDDTITANTDNNLNTEIEMKQLLITAFALQAVTAESSDTAVLNALRSKFTDLENEKNSAEQASADLKGRLEQFQETQITAVIEAHAKTNKITDEKKEILKSIGKTSGVDALMAVLETEPQQQAPNINGLLQKGKSEARAGWNWDQWQKEDPRGLEALAVSDKEAYNKLFNEKYQK